MSDEYGCAYGRSSDGTGWLVGIVVTLALMAIGYLAFSENGMPVLQRDEVACMVVNPGFTCTEHSVWKKGPAVGVQP